MESWGETARFNHSRTSPAKMQSHFAAIAIKSMPAIITFRRLPSNATLYTVTTFFKYSQRKTRYFAVMAISPNPSSL